MGSFLPTHWLYYVSYIVSDIGGLYLSPALALSVTNHTKMRLHCCLLISVLTDIVLSVSGGGVLCVVFMHSGWCRPSLCAWTIVRWWLQSSSILQSAEVVSSINQVEFVSVTLCMLILVWVEITRVNGGHSSHFLDQDTGGNAEWPESLSFLEGKFLFLWPFLWV